MVFSIMIRLIIYGYVLYEIFYRGRKKEGYKLSDILWILFLIIISYFIVNKFLTPIDWSELQ